MKIIGKVQGSLEQALSTIVNVDTVYVHNNIKKIEKDYEGNPVNNLYEYDEVQYTLQEYIALIGSSLDVLLGGTHSSLIEENSKDTRKALKFFANTLRDEQALEIPSLYDSWQPNTSYKKDDIISYDSGSGIILYRVGQEHTSLENQKPCDEGMLAIYRPIEIAHQGTIEDPIPWIYGMDCYKDKYYIHENKKYLCKNDMIPCVWEPGTIGVYQWELIEE